MLPTGELVDVTPPQGEDSTLVVPNTTYNPKTAVSNVDRAPSMLDRDQSTWLQSLDMPEGEEGSSSGKMLIYIVEAAKGKEAFIVSAVTTSILKSGALGSGRSKYRLDNVESYNRGKYVQDNDLVILRLIKAVVSYAERHGTDFKIPGGGEGVILLKMLVSTGRCYLAGKVSIGNELTIGDIRSASIGWKIGPDGTQSINVKLQGTEGTSSPIIINSIPLYYICPVSKTVGELNIGLPSRQIQSLLNAPKIKPAQASFFRERLAAIFGATPELLPSIIPIRTTYIEPVPVLTLKDITIQPQKIYNWKMRPTGEPVNIAVAEPAFRYMDRTIAYDDSLSEFTVFAGEEVHLIARDKETEIKRLKELQSYGFTMTVDEVSDYYDIKPAYRSYFTIGVTKANFHKDKNLPVLWEAFVRDKVPVLMEQGWKIKMEPDFRYNIVSPDDEWYAEVEDEGSIDWFGVALGVNIEGKRFNLLPILLDLLKQDSGVFQTINTLPAEQPFLIPMKDGRRLALPAERAKILLGILQQIFSFQNNLDEAGRLRLGRLDAALLAEIEAAALSLNMRWFGGDILRKLGKKLKQFDAITGVPVPQNFSGELRGYQQYGLNWLQFLREYDLSGILADDMGLGKTVQVLAHIAVEKAAKRLDAPFLVIAPTSLMSNWKTEAARFVPDLKVLTLHGIKRKEYFKDVGKYDLILTTYPLLPRDKDHLLSHSYHTIILDEAQTIKNANAKITQITNQLKSRYRLCMTGTPLENHLGELWSLFNFLLPGYLGNRRQFGNLFRTPIEKSGDVKCSETLMRRIRPFILRRTKQEVATELPAKTEILRVIELEGVQRDLYETIRVSMNEKVRKEIATHGMAKSHIIVLDALLKLRQVCCDPALLKIDIAKNITQSAKRDELMNMLTEMIEEGRKILLFSQFTGMLKLIEAELNRKAISYVKLTGETKDRETPIRDFQEGKVPLFLISLKAGGTGLNLTAADTVIHYDPWWNPAAENQATDRAYRIGQDKPVLVYKLITSGTVEEKIIEMQNKKRRLMDSIFNINAKSESKLTANDIQALFEPL